MAFPTQEQANTKRHLVAEYGECDRYAIEKTTEPYGLVWLRWFDKIGDRNLFIKPDGSRLTWNQEI
jgi:hypothetical protein